MQENKTHYLVALLLGVVGLLIILIFVSMRSQAETGTATSSVSINNYTPTVDSVTISTESGGAGADVTLLDDSTVTVYVHGEYTDANGCDDITTGAGFLNVALASSSTEPTCTIMTRSSNDCYIGSMVGGENEFHPEASDIIASTATGLCSVSSCSSDNDQTATYECTFPRFKFWADAGNWKARVSVGDGTPTSGFSIPNYDLYSTVNTLTAIGLLDSSVNYGSMPVASTSGAFGITIENTGNDEDLDIDLSGTLMTCDLGDFSKGDNPGIAAQAYDLLGSQAWGSMTALTGSATKVDINVTESDSTSTLGSVVKPTGEVYWKLKTPLYGVAGSCSSTITVVADGT